MVAANTTSGSSPELSFSLLTTLVQSHIIVARETLTAVVQFRLLPEDVLTAIADRLTDLSKAVITNKTLGIKNASALELVDKLNNPHVPRSDIYGIVEDVNNSIALLNEQLGKYNTKLKSPAPGLQTPEAAPQAPAPAKSPE